MPFLVVDPSILKLKICTSSIQLRALRTRQKMETGMTA